MSLRALMATAAGGLALALAAGAAPLQAQGNPNDLNLDSKLIRDVASDNLLEIRLGTIAKKKASNAAVQQFGDRMVTDHTRMLDDWRALVGKTGYPFQPGLRNEQEQEVKTLEKLSGAEFDRAYMTSMVQDHQNAVVKFQSQGQTAHSSQVRDLVTAELPTLQQHLSLAQQVGAQVGATTGVAVATPAPTPTVPTQAQNPTPTQNPPVANQTTQVGQENLRPDSKFIREALADNMLEIRMGEMAERSAQNQAVKDYARQVVSDHQAMRSQWVALAARNGLTVKPGMGPRHKKKADRLEKLSGKDFDKAYMTTQVQNQQDYVEYFGKEGRQANSSQVRAQAANDAISLQLHLDRAKQVGSQVGVNVTGALRARNTAAYRSN